MSWGMRKGLRSILALALIAAMLLLSGCNVRKAADKGQSASSGTAGTAAAPYYQGKTIEIIVPFKEGGGTDLYARFVAPYLEKNIEGNPKIIIKNMAGGESITGANWFATNAKPDGLTLLASSASTVFPALLGRPEVKYDINKMKPVMVTPTGGVVYSSSKNGVASIGQLKTPPKPLVYGGISASGLDLVPLLAYEVLGLNVKSVLGFEGRGPARLAFERGETNIDYQTTTAYLSNVVPLIKEGKAAPLMSFGIIGKSGALERDPVVKDVPTVGEAYEKLRGKAPSGPAWQAYLAFTSAGFAYQKVLWVPEGTPKEATDALNEAVEKIAKDPDFNSKGAKALGGYPTFAGKDVEKAVRQVLTVPADVRQWVTDLLKTKYNVNF